LEEEYSIDTMYYPYEYTYSGKETTIKINEEVFPGIIGEEIIEISELLVTLPERLNELESLKKNTELEICWLQQNI
jgi:hypothetical protein